MSWKKQMEIALYGRSQLGFVRGEYPMPTDPAMAARWKNVLMSSCHGSYHLCQRA